MTLYRASWFACSVEMDYFPPTYKVVAGVGSFLRVDAKKSRRLILSGPLPGPAEEVTASPVAWVYAGPDFVGGERDRAELAAFEALLSKCIADALVAKLRKEAEAHGVDVVTWHMRDKSTGACAPTQRPLVEDQGSQPNRNTPLRSILRAGSDGCATRRVGSQRG
jgi:hypothetical protein